MRLREFKSDQCKEMHFASFLSSGFTAVINPKEKKHAIHTSVQWSIVLWLGFATLDSGIDVAPGINVAPPLLKSFT